MSPTQQIKLSTAVMAHPSRKEQAEQLRRRHPELDLQIVLDPDPAGPPTTLRTSRLAWSRMRPGATHHLVLQDDVQLCHGFLESALRALSAVPAAPVALFADWAMTTSQSVRLAALAGASWTPVVDEWTPTQALVLPASLASGYVDYTARFSLWKPDNRAMSAFLESRGLVAAVCIPSLVQHRPVRSLLLNDLLYGVREATVFPEGKVGEIAIGERVVAPPAIAQLGVGGTESHCHYQPLAGTTLSSTTPAHELLARLGVSNAELAEGFASDLDHNGAARSAGFGRSFLFQVWLVMFVQGIIARGVLQDEGVTDLQAALDTKPWALPSIETFPAGVLRKVVPSDSAREVARRFAPFCVDALRSGFAAPDYWPDLKILWKPDEYAIKPRWNEGLERSDRPPFHAHDVSPGAGGATSSAQQ